MENTFTCIRTSDFKICRDERKEGTALVNDILNKREQIQKMLETIKQRCPFVVNEYKEKLQNRIKRTFVYSRNR